MKKLVNIPTAFALAIISSAEPPIASQLMSRDAPVPMQRSRVAAARGSKRLRASRWVGENNGLLSSVEADR